MLITIHRPTLPRPGTPHNTTSPHPPYRLPEALLGGIPTPLPDLPPIIILILLFAFYLLTHLLISHLTQPDRAPSSHRHLILRILMTLFPITRIAALCTRLAWTFHPSALRLEMAATVLTPAGTVMLLVSNLILARRFARDYTAFGFHPAMARVGRVVVIVTLIALVMGISVRADSYFTRDAEGLRECRDIGLVAVSIWTAVAVVPGVVVLVASWKRDKEAAGRDRRRMRARGQLIGFVSGLLTLGEGFRCGVAFEGRMVGDGAWFLSKACYYVFVFVVEVVIVYALLGSRLDPRFRLKPRGVGKPEGAEEKVRWYDRLVDRVNTDKEVFGEACDRAARRARGLEGSEQL